MAFQAHKDLAYSIIPSGGGPAPNTTGNSLQVNSASDRALFPTPPFMATVWPQGVVPTASNAEIIQVNGTTGTTGFVIARAQEQSTAQPIAAGYQIAATITTRPFTDLETSVQQLNFNVKYYGAVGDGTTDDTAAIQALANLMTTGGVMYFPPGTYFITSVVRVPFSNTVLKGSGTGTTTIVPGFDGAYLNANPAIFRFQSSSGSTPVSNCVIRDMTFDLNHRPTPAFEWKGCSSSSTTSSNFLAENIEIMHRGADHAGQTACVSVHGDYSSIQGPVQNLTLRDINIHDGDATDSVNTEATSILITASSLSHVLFERVILNNVYGDGIQYGADANFTNNLSDWTWVNCSFIKCIQNNLSSSRKEIINSVSRSPINGARVINCLFDHSQNSWVFGDNVMDMSFANSNNIVVEGCVFIKSKGVWDIGYSSPNGRETISIQFSNNLVYKVIQFEDPDGNFAAKYNDNVFYQVQYSPSMGGYGIHRASVISGNLFYNCMRNAQPGSVYFSGLIVIQDGGAVIENNTIYNDNPQGNPTAPTATINATAGNLNGQYIYRVTFVIRDYGESAGGVSSAPVYPVNQKVNLTNIPLGQPGCSSRNIYRTKAWGSDGTEQLVANLDGNTTTTYTDNIADSALGVAIPTTDTTTNQMGYVFMEQSGGGRTDMPIIWKNNTVVGAGPLASTFFLDSNFQHVITGNTGLTESVLTNSATNSARSITALAATDVVSGNYQANGQPLSNDQKLGGLGLQGITMPDTAQAGVATLYYEKTAKALYYQDETGARFSVNLTAATSTSTSSTSSTSSSTSISTSSTSVSTSSTSSSTSSTSTSHSISSTSSSVSSTSSSHSTSSTSTSTTVIAFQ